MGMIEEINQLLPSTHQWMIQRGYLTRKLEDGEMVLAVTKKGWEYLHGCRERKS